MSGEVVAYRHAAYDTPWWAAPSSRPGRFHRAGTQTTQYLCLHPLGPAAEMLRQVVAAGEDPEVFRSNLKLHLWAVKVDPSGLVRVGFGDCGRYGIAPDALVGDDYGPTQALGDALRDEDAPGMIAPSAALPGTDNLVLFGPRLIVDYVGKPTSSVEVLTGHLTADARPVSEVVPLVRWYGTPHAALVEWQRTGSYTELEDPPALRW